MGGFGNSGSERFFPWIRNSIAINKMEAGCQLASSPNGVEIAATVSSRFHKEGLKKMLYFSESIGRGGAI
jgi:hypothetical protein